MATSAVWFAYTELDKMCAFMCIFQVETQYANVTIFVSVPTSGTSKTGGIMEPIWAHRGTQDGAVT